MRLEGGVAIVALQGSASMDQVGGLRERLLSLAEPVAARIILDLSHLAFINSAGLGAIIAAHQSALAHAGDLRIASPQPAVQRLLRLTRIGQTVPIHPSLEAARRALAAAPG
ncbi:MAG: STAS domain-containing protein [Planctomycetes bacterium]|nr:STAS domain-containing protein [Planctomycetota bacterium]